jgi:hypothetical protein
MRKIFLLTAIAAAAMVVQRAEAITPVAPVFPGIDAHTGTAHFIANVCGSAGCAPVQTKRYQRPPKPGSVAAHHI